jgi:hypothetical protein
MVRSILTLAVGFALAGLAPGDDKKPEAPKSDPEGTPLELTIKGTAKYSLNTGGFSAADCKKYLEDTAKKGKPFSTPAVELTVEIKNTSDKNVKVWAAGDPAVLTLTLKGKGALDLDPPIAFTDEFRLPKSVEVEAGKTYTIPVKSLTSGFRGKAHVSYWTEPGDYELVATLKTGMSPAPKGAKEGMDGFGVVTLTSAPFKVTVEEKK